MKTDTKTRGDYYEPDMSLPPWVLHFFPVVLALFTLTMSVAGNSVFFGCDEGEPMTWMSLTLMLTVLVVLLTGIRNGALEPFQRWAAIVLSAVTGFAILDEKLRWHERFGRYVKNEHDFFTRDVLHYTDDAVVVLFALAGATLLYFFVRRLKNHSDYIPYVACAVALALAHGILDVLGHGGRLWRTLIPDISIEQVGLLTETLGFYEECCKLWAEWFVLLFVLRLLQDQRGPLMWSTLVMIGSFLSGAGLWAIEDPSIGIPYVVMEGTLQILRNYHLLIALTCIFAAWALASWRLFGDQPKKQAIAGLFFLAPFYALLPEIARVPGDVLSTLGATGTILSATALLAVVGLLWSRQQYRALLIVVTTVAIALGLVGSSIDGLSGQPLLLLTIGGVLLPLAVGLLVHRRERVGKRAIIIAIVLAAALFQNPLWLLVAFAIAFAMGIERLTSPVSVRAWSMVVSLQAITILVVFYVSAPGILPEYPFEIPEKVIFETGTQEIDPDYYRSKK